MNWGSSFAGQARGAYGQTSAHEVTAMSFARGGFVVDRTGGEGHTPFGADRRRIRLQFTPRFIAGLGVG